jgi:hypothetical protein
MRKYWFVAAALMLCAGLLSVPAMAQTGNVDDVGTIQRGGGEGVQTKLGSRGLEIETEGFSLRFTTRAQFRFTHQQEVANGSDGTNGRNFNNFRVRRLKTSLNGHIYDKSLRYNTTLSWASGANIIEVMHFQWALQREFNLNVGQHKLPWSWEEITSSGNLQFVDRGYTNSVFTHGFAKGAWVDGSIENNMLMYSAGVYNGVLRGSADFRNNDQALRGDSFDDGFVDTDMMLNLRLESHPIGRVPYGLNDMRSADAFDKPQLAVGLGVNYFWSGFNNQNIRPDTSGAGATASGRSRTSQDTLSVTADAHFRMYGFSLDAAIFWRHTEFHNRGSNRYRPTTPARNGISNLSDVGATVEASYFIIPREVNVGVRWNYYDADEVWINGSSTRSHALRPDANEIGVGMNYYIHGNNLKLTADVLYVSQQLAQRINANGGAGQALAGVYNSPPDRSASSIANGVSDYNDLWILRIQLQWVF